MNRLSGYKNIVGWISVLFVAILVEHTDVVLRLNHYLMPTSLETN